MSTGQILFVGIDWVHMEPVEAKLKKVKTRVISVEIVGMTYGKKKWRERTAMGTLVCPGVCPCEKPADQARTDRALIGGMDGERFYELLLPIFQGASLVVGHGLTSKIEALEAEARRHHMLKLAREIQEIPRCCLLDVTRNLLPESLVPKDQGPKLATLHKWLTGERMPEKGTLGTSGSPTAMASCFQELIAQDYISFLN